MPSPIPKKNSPNFHYDFIVRGERFSGSTGTPNRKLAQAIIDRIHRDALLPSEGRPDISIDDAAALYQDRVERLASWPTTRYVLHALVIGLGPHRTLASVTQKMLIDHFARRRARADGKLRSDASINREIDVARALWRTADAARFAVGDRPDWRALYRRTGATRWALLDAGAVEESYFAAVRADVVDALRFLLASGWRRGEVLRLGWGDIDVAARGAWVRGKHGDTLLRPLTPSLMALLLRQPRAVPGSVFTYICQRADASGRKDRTPRRQGQRYPLSASVLRLAHAEARAAIKMPELRLHDLRHTRATRTLAATQNLALTARVMDHKSLKTTLRYAHIMADDIRAALEETPAKSPHTATAKGKK